MALVRAKEWIEKTFVLGSRPSAITIRKWIVLGEINGKIINGNCFIEETAPFKTPTPDDNEMPIVRGGSVLDELRTLGVLKT